MFPLRSRLLVLLLLVGLVAVACDDDDDSSDLVVESGIGPAGGTVAVDGGELAGTSITIAPGTFTETVCVSIHEDLPSLVPGFRDIGPAVRVEPVGLGLAPPATLVLPFDPAAVSPLVKAGDFVVRVRAADGQVSDEVPREVDPVAGRVVHDVARLATWWVTVPDVIQVRDYLPLGSGDRYVYDTHLQLTVVETRSEPNFEGIPVTKLTFSTPYYFVAGPYLRSDSEGNLDLLGEFEIALDNRQERLDNSVLMLPAEATIGEPRSVFYTFLGFIPYGVSVPFYFGSAQTIVGFTGRESVATAAGTFEDTVVLEGRVDRTDTRPRASTTRWRAWLAEGIGPVQIQFDQGTVHRLVAANVGGVHLGN
jgi:hypothetical protein